jgi:hypothetical protein
MLKLATPSPGKRRPGWSLCRQAGHPNPGVYVQGSLWQATRNEFTARGIPEPRWWIAKWDGVAEIPPGAFAKQYAAPHPGTPYDSGGHFDLSVFAYTFGGSGGTIDTDMTPEQDAKLTQVWEILTQLGSYPVGQAALDSAEILRHFGDYAVGKGAIAAGVAAPIILQDLADLKASITASGTALTPAQAKQLTHIEAMLTGGLKGA